MESQHVTSILILIKSVYLNPWDYLISAIAFADSKSYSAACCLASTAAVVAVVVVAVVVAEQNLIDNY